MITNAKYRRRNNLMMFFIGLHYLATGFDQPRPSSGLYQEFVFVNDISILEPRKGGV